MENIYLKNNFWLNLLKIKKEDIPEDIIIYGSWYFEKILHLLGENIEKIKDTNLPNLKIGKSNGKKIFYSVSYGPTMTAEISHMAGVLGVKKIILIGSCGTLRNNSNPIIVVNKSISEEGVSNWYNKEKIPVKSTENLFKKSINFFTSNNIGFDVGKVVTINHMLMENKDDINRWYGNENLGVELETSVVYNVAKYFNMERIALLRQSDSLRGNKNKINIENKKNHRNAIIKCALEIIKPNINNFTANTH